MTERDVESQIHEQMDHSMDDRPEMSADDQGTAVFLLPADDVPPGEVRRVDIPDRPAIAVYNLDGRFYATEDKCSHGNASLADGDIDGDEIICPFHSGAFSIITGEPTQHPCGIPIKTFDVFIQSGNIYCKI